MEISIHGHAVMDRMVASGLKFSRASLVAFIEQEFGPAARYHTCSAADMTAADLVEFLASRGKFTGPPHAFALDLAHRCSH